MRENPAQAGGDKVVVTAVISRTDRIEYQRSLWNLAVRRGVVVLWAVAASLSLVCMAFLDGRIAEAADALPGGVYRVAQTKSDWLTLGYVWPVIVLSALICVWGGLRDAARWLMFAILASLLSGAVVNVIKFVVGRQRPFVRPHEPLQFEVFSTAYKFNSFPSGHSSDAAVWATVIALTCPRLRGVALVLAMVFASTRVVIDAHWLSDVLMGLTVGMVTTLVLHAALIRKQVEPLRTSKRLSRR